jgi:hypothetical protein
MITGAPEFKARAPEINSSADARGEVLLPRDLAR